LANHDRSPFRTFAQCLCTCLRRARCRPYEPGHLKLYVLPDGCARPAAGRRFRALRFMTIRTTFETRECFSCQIEKADLEGCLPRRCARDRIARPGAIR